MSRFEMKEGEPFDWKAFQKHMQFTDEELEAFKSHPKKGKSVEYLFNPKFRNKFLVVEVVESKACGNGLRPGDRLYFAVCSSLDTKKGRDRWCSHALARIGLFADTLHNFFMQGLDPKEMYFDHFTCPDAGAKLGHGLVTFKAYVVDKSDLDKMG